MIIYAKVLDIGRTLLQAVLYKELRTFCMATLWIWRHFSLRVPAWIHSIPINELVFELLLRGRELSPNREVIRYSATRYSVYPP